MARYLCVTFDFEDGLKHGIKKNLWLMQSQNAHDEGNVFQGDRKAAIRRNWEQLVTAGVKCV